jgi:hypothetical protein
LKPRHFAVFGEVLQVIYADHLQQSVGFRLARAVAAIFAQGLNALS